MQRVSASFLQPGMVVASNVYSSDSRLLISAESTLTATTVTKIQQLGVGSIYIHNPLFKNLAIPELVKEDTRVKTILALHNTIKNYQKTQNLNILPLKSVIKPLVAEIIHNRDSMVHLLDLRTYEDYVFGHSVNVCILAVLIALHMDYNEDKLNDLALGALLHDLGMTLISKDILIKVGKLSPEELQVVQKHTESGFDVLRKMRDIPIPVAHIAFQHHERFDGKGYPRTLKGKDIIEYARITAVADIFDALISDRPYRKGLLPHEAYEILMTLGDTYVDKEILNLFLTNVAVYPVGTIVQLNTKEYAIVTKVLPKLQSRPKLRVLTNKQGTLLEKAVDVNLTEHLTLFVDKVLKENEVFELSKSVDLK